MSYKGYHFKGTTQAAFWTALNAFMLQIGWEVHVNKFKAYTTLTSTGNCANTNTLTIDGKVYTMKTTLTPAEGEILLGGTAADSLANIKLAINRTDPGTNDGVKYKVAAAHSTVSAETLTATTLFIQALTAGSAGNSIATTETLANMTLTGTVLANGSDNMVYKSNGESGYEPYGYVYFVNDATGITVLCYQYWDETVLPQGNGAYRLAGLTYTGYNSRLLAASRFLTTNQYFIGGDKDMVALSIQLANAEMTTSGYSAPYCQWGLQFGHLSKRLNAPDYPVLTTAGLTAGNNVSVSVTDASKIVAGSYIQILGKQVSTFEGCDRLHVQSVTNSTTFVVDNVPRDYVSGAFIGNPASTFGYTGDGYGGSQSNNYGYWSPCSFWSDAAKSVSGNKYTFYVPMLYTPAVTNTGFTGVSGETLKSYMVPWFVQWDILVGYVLTPFYYIGSIANLYDCLIANNDLSISPQYTVSSATNNTLTDLSRSWTPDALIGKFVVLSVGLSNGQARLIIDNDATSITVDKDWDTTNPDGTTNYKICDTLYRATGAKFITSLMTGVKITNTSIPA